MAEKIEGTKWRNIKRY